MHLKLKQTLAGVATLAAAAGALPLLAASPAAAATNQGTLTLSPTSGTSAGTYNLAFPAGSSTACAGDSATNGYRVQGFVVPTSQDLNAMTFNSVGPVGGQPLIDQFGNTFVNAQTDITTGNISQLPGIYTFQYNAPGDFAPGTYYIGVACTQGTGAGMTKSFWSKTITITQNTTTGGPAQIDWAQGAVPGAPTINTVTTGDGTLTVAFTGPSAADPAVSTYTLTATPQGGGTAIVQTGATSPITLTGLTNGQAYDLSLTATNSVGTSIAATGTGTPAPGVRDAVSNLSATPTIGGVDLTWVAPTDFTPTGYDLGIDDGTATTTVTLAAGTTSYSATGLPAGVVHTFTVTPLYPSPYVASPSSVTGTPLAAQVLVQDITVTRPVGALVLTQVCGAYGELASEGAQLGFPSGLPLAPAVNSSTVAAPSAGGTAPTLTAGGVTTDPVAGQYPYPTNPDGTANPTYPTHCGIDLGNAQFVRSGAGAGQFYAADGRLNQVTVVDTRDADTGWNVVGQVSNFTAGPGKSFSGSQLGWVPVVTEDTGSFVDSLGNTYDQVATAGGAIAPNSAVAAGLSSNRTLIQANGAATVAPSVTNGGLGTAIADARLKLLIPVTAQAGTYTAVLTISTL